MIVNIWKAKPLDRRFLAKLRDENLHFFTRRGLDMYGGFWYSDYMRIYPI